MATFKVNYAGLRKTQTKNEPSKNFSEPAVVINQPTSSQSTLAPRTSSKVSTATHKEDAGFLSPYQSSFHSENMEYINLLLKNKTSSTTKDKSPTEPKKKGRGRTKSNLVDSTPKQSPLHLNSNSPQSNRQLVAVPMNSVEENDKPTSMRPDDDDGFQIIKNSIKKPTKQVKEVDRGQFYEGDDTQRNVVFPPSQFEGKIFERFVKEEGGNRRSMSVEDIRVEKKALIANHNHNKSTLHDPTELGSYFERSPERNPHHDSKHSNGSMKGDFIANLDGFIDYFHKSEDVSYRNMKAGQYIRGSSKSHKHFQKDLDAALHELNVRKMQIQELKNTINEVLAENKVLKKELKAVHLREQEHHQVMQKMQAEILHLQQKNHQYKSRCMQTQELLQHERSDNENNLLSLKHVLANINIALEQRTSPFRNATREKQSQLKSTLIDNLFAKKNRENFSRNYSTKENARLNGTMEGYGSIYDTVNHRIRSIERKGQRESSMLMSQKDSLLSSEEQSESLSSNQFSNSNKYDQSEEDEYRYQGHYQDSYRQSISKNQQIRLLQDKLTELMGTDDLPYETHTPHAQAGGIKTSRAKKPQHRRNVSDIGAASYYMSRDRERQGSISKHASLLSKYSPKEQRSRNMHNGYGDTPSMNGTERSFSVHESQEITE